MVDDGSVDATADIVLSFAKKAGANSDLIRLSPGFYKTGGKVSPTPTLTRTLLNSKIHVPIRCCCSPGYAEHAGSLWSNGRCRWCM